MTMRSRVKRLEHRAGVGDTTPCRCGPSVGIDVWWPARPPRPWLEGAPSEPIDYDAACHLTPPKPARCPECRRERRLFIVRWQRRELPRRAS